VQVMVYFEVLHQHSHWQSEKRPWNLSSQQPEIHAKSDPVLSRYKSRQMLLRWGTQSLLRGKNYTLPSLSGWWKL